MKKSLLALALIVVSAIAFSQVTIKPSATYKFNL